MESILLATRSPNEVGVGGKFGGRAFVLSAWRRQCHRGFQRTGSVRVMAMGGRKKVVGKNGEDEKPELKFEANDLMELEFGRLLGEPRQATLAKVIGRKANPSASYIDIEKKPIKEFKSSSSSELSEAEFARLLNKEGNRNAQPLEGVYKSQKVALEEDLPSLVKPPSRPGQPLPQVTRWPPSTNFAQTKQAKKAVPLVTFGPSGFAAQTNKPQSKEDDYTNLVQKPTISSPDSHKPSWPNIDTVPPMLLGKSKKVVESDYTDHVQKPAIPNPDSVRPLWPKNDSIPPMLIGKSKKSIESLNKRLLRRSISGDTIRSPSDLDNDVESRIGEDPKVLGKPLKSKHSSKSLPNSPSLVLASSSPDIFEERFAKLLEFASSTGEDQDIPSEVLIPTTMDDLSKQKKTLKAGRKLVLATKPPLQEDEIQEVTSGGTSMSISTNDLPKGSPSPIVAVEATRLEENVDPMDSDAKSDADFNENPTMDLAKENKKQFDPEQALLQLIKKASRTPPVTPPKQFPQAISKAIKAKIADMGGLADDRLVGWSDEVKDIVKRSEATLPRLGTQTPSETKFDQLLDKQKAELQQRLVPPPTPKILPNPTEVSTQQRALSRTIVSGPKPPRIVVPANLLQQSGVFLSDRRIPSKEEENQDWARAKALQESKTVEEIVFTQAISNGMLANFGSLVGFLASYELSNKRRPPSFSAWAQENGFKINRKLKSSAASKNDDPDSESTKGTERIGGVDEEYKRWLDIYENFCIELLSALIGKTAKVVVVEVERERKQLRFSEKKAEGEDQELALKRTKLMRSLNVGDVVKCTIKKVTSFGAFVELEEVPALIHISELSWNRVTNPSTILKVEQEVEVKVCRIDRYLQRISLSLKQMQMDPLRETLESLDLQGTALDDPDDETTLMPELIGLTNRLQAYKGIESVRIGRRLQGNALAPTFQVYLSDKLEDGFKLLARFGNLVQEVLVQTALDRDSMKDAIRQCTFSDD